MDSPFITLPDSALQNLVCLNCRNHLSIFPIYTKTDNSGALCGRCKLDEPMDFVRDKAYEIIGQILNFPCRYVDNGCQKMSTPPELVKHEHCCVFRKFDCPSRRSTGCPWRGARVELFDHFAQHHNNLVLLESHFELNLTTDRDGCFLLAYDDELFVVRIELNTRADTFMCEIEHLTATEDSRAYEFILSLENIEIRRSFKFDSRVTCTNEGSHCSLVALNFVRTMLLQPTSIIVNVHLFRTNLACAVENRSQAESPPDLNWELLNELQCVGCNLYMVPPIFWCTNDHSYCAQCRRTNYYDGRCPFCQSETKSATNFVLEKLSGHIIYPCRYIGSGCKLLFKSTDIGAHQLNCDYGDYDCPITKCSWRDTHTKLAEHIEYKHDDLILRGGEIRVQFAKNTPFRNVAWIEYDAKIFKFFFKFDKDNFFWTVQLVGPPDESEMYKFEIGVIDASDSKTKCFNMGFVVPLTPDKECFNGSGNYLVNSLDHLAFLTDTLSFKITIFKR